MFQFINRGNCGLSWNQAVHSIVDLKDKLSQHSDSRQLLGYILPQCEAANIIKATTQKAQETTEDRTGINLPHQYR